MTRLLHVNILLTVYPVIMSSNFPVRYKLEKLRWEKCVGTVCHLLPYRWVSCNTTYYYCILYYHLSGFYCVIVLPYRWVKHCGGCLPDNNSSFRKSLRTDWLTKDEDESKVILTFLNINITEECINCSLYVTAAITNG